jgi:hypothetical protein
MSLRPAARFLLLASMVWGLALAPFAHALSMAAAMADAQQEAVSHCHQSDSDNAPKGDCCCHKGSVCHCAVPVALPSGLPLTSSPVPAIYTVVSVAFLLHNLPPPEPPPPRRA